ncbi:MAG: right-handed parallel beta-helix repeat-containing protein [Acidobacteria bacterium]|nr:right-handed parallel beta-helix repeat-containing protein [Acidobacteriota bacterium]
MRLILAATFFASILTFVAASLPAAIYEVGPGKPYESIGVVPWESLEPGDTVLIHWRPEPYKEKWVLCRQGTDSEPITVRGVPGPNGELPVIDGNGATTRTALNYWNEIRGILKIGGASNPPDTMPRYIVVESLEFRAARPPYSFKSANGRTLEYALNAAALYVEKGEHITIRNCILRDSGNGLFIGSPSTEPSRDFLIESNYILDNGNEGRGFEHNSYTAAIGIVFQYNRYGPLRAGAQGNNLKDRSAGLTVRYNWIEGGNRQLDLVDGEDSSVIVADPAYRSTYVYGNILIERDNDGNRQMIHYGGDSGIEQQYRKGALYAYNNTFVSLRRDRTTLVRLSTNEEAARFFNNIFYVIAAGGTLSLVDSSGRLELSHNWFKPGYVATFATLAGDVLDDGTSVLGSSPAFADESQQDFRLTASSPARNAGMPLPEHLAAIHPVLAQYLKHQTSEPRPGDEQIDMGAYEFLENVPGGTKRLPR